MSHARIRALASRWSPAVDCTGCCARWPIRATAKAHGGPLSLGPWRPPLLLRPRRPPERGV